MLIAVTGAGGFVGRAVTRRLAEAGVRRVRLIDLQPPGVCPPEFERVGADLSDSAALAAALEGATHVIHLAALPGGAAERDPAASRAINLTATLDLLDLLGARAVPARVVHASSIAVFGSDLPAEVDDATPARPDSVYGAHKAMAEIALADVARRGRVDAVALRLPGIVARPGCGGGFRSAFMSDIFMSLAERRPCTLPVGPEATMWLLSARAAAAALVNAALASALPAGQRVLTLPALRVRMADLVAAIAYETGADANALVRYAPDPETQALFGALPAHATPAADALGFEHDGSLDRLVANALAEVRR